ncbi:MAG: hypothetical protein FJY67_10635 [Calditrichaeota bacterium]|nr:hypothetical protein [Calditrichota bacterium]
MNARIVTLIVLALLTIRPAHLVAQRTYIGTEGSPLNCYGGFIAWNQTGHRADDFSYRYLQEGGFTTDLPFVSSVVAQQGQFSYRSLFSHYGIKPYLGAGAGADGYEPATANRNCFIEQSCRQWSADAGMENPDPMPLMIKRIKRMDADF